LLAALWEDYITMQMQKGFITVSVPKDVVDLIDVSIAEINRLSGEKREKYKSFFNRFHGLTRSSFVIEAARQACENVSDLIALDSAKE
jgi:hypothetical protein